MPVNPNAHITELRLPQPLYHKLLREGLTTVEDVAYRTPQHLVERYKEPLVMLIQALQDGSYFPPGRA